VKNLLAREPRHSTLPALAAVSAGQVRCEARLEVRRSFAVLVPKAVCGKPSFTERAHDNTEVEIRSEMEDDSALRRWTSPKLLPRTSKVRQVPMPTAGT